MVAGRCGSGVLVWEVRVAVGRDPVSGRSRYRSLTVHGDREGAQAARERRIYSHVLPLTDADAATTLDRLYRT